LDESQAIFSSLLASHEKIYLRKCKTKEKGKVKGSGRGRTALYVQMLRVYGMCCIEQ
jgi:hypothetical protein